MGSLVKCFSLIRSCMIRLTNQCHVSYVFEILDFLQNVCFYLAWGWLTVIVVICNVDVCCFYSTV